MARYIYRCPSCRTRRTTLALHTAHMRSAGHAVCRCFGYHYAHRPGSRYCRENPLGVLFEADRAGASDDDLRLICDRILADDPGLADSVADARSVLGLG